MSLDFIAGCVGGCAGVLVGHPLDTIKVHLQTQDPRNPVYRGTWHCMKTIVKNDSIKGLYRGITSPMAGVSLVNAIVFGIYGNVQRHAENPDSLKSHFLAGSIAGFVQSVVCAPMELAKTRIQLQHDSDKGLKHKGPLDCLRHIVRTEGLKGFFKGTGITAVRDVPGFAGYFVSYEYMMRMTSSPTAFHSLIAGGFAGMFSWLVCYPMDVVKTCIQADGMRSAPKYTGVFDCIRKGYQSDGIHFFLRGLQSTLIRSFPMNATCFFIVSWIMRMSKTTQVDVVVHSSDSLAMVGISNTPLIYIHQYEYNEIERKRTYLVRSMVSLSTLNEAVCQSEVEELANELYPGNCEYYILDDKRLQNRGNGNSRER